MSHIYREQTPLSQNGLYFAKNTPHDPAEFSLHYHDEFELTLVLGVNGKRIVGNVVDDFGNTYDTHPLTGKKFSELQLPWITEAFEMCKEAALVVPQMRYIGWDVAFSKDGPLIVEGNEYPGYGLFQYYMLKGSRTGHLEEIRQIVGDDEIKRIKRA